MSTFVLVSTKVCVGMYVTETSAEEKKCVNPLCCLLQQFLDTICEIESAVITLSVNTHDSQSYMLEIRYKYNTNRYKPRI